MHVPRTLPVVLSGEEVPVDWRSQHLKNQTSLSVACGAGLCASGVVTLKVEDADGQRMTLRIEQGKVHKDRGCARNPSGFAAL